jgi:hypothetical protein
VRRGSVAAGAGRDYAPAALIWRFYGPLNSSVRYREMTWSGGLGCS